MFAAMSTEAWIIIVFLAVIVAILLVRGRGI